MRSETDEEYSDFVGQTVGQIFQIKAIIAGASAINDTGEENPDISHILFNAEQQLAKMALDVSNTEFQYKTKIDDAE